MYLPQPIPQKQAGPLSPRRKREGLTESWRGFQRTNSAATASPRFVVPRGKQAHPHDNPKSFTQCLNLWTNACNCWGVAGRGNPTHLPYRTNILDACFFVPSKKNMKNGMILPFVTSNMLTRKRPFPREGSLSLVLATEVVIMGWYSQGFGHKNFELLQWPLNCSGGVAGPG
jgi:hypothetical protein